MTSYKVAGVTVGPTGYGLMGFSWRPDDKLPHSEAVKVLKAATESGTLLWNGGEFYGRPEPEHNLELISEYFKTYPEDVSKICLSIKGAVDPKLWAPDGSRENVERSIETTLKYLNVAGKKLDLFCVARVDKKYGIEVAAEVVKTYVDKGLIGGLCLSECSVETIKKAQAITPVAAVEIEYSLWSREAEENGVLKYCAEHHIPVVAYSPLGKGFLSGKLSMEQVKGDMRGHMDRFQEENRAKNQQLVDKITEIAKRHNVENAQVALEWIRTQSGRNGLPVIVPIPGSRSASRVQENATRVNLSEADMKEINDFLQTFKVSGYRYMEAAEGSLYV